MSHPQNTITNALAEPDAMPGVSEADVGGKVKIEGKEPIIEKTKDDPAMKAQTVVPFVGTNIIPDRNAGIGSLLRDLQDSRDLNREGPPLLDPAFAFIDVGVSRAKAAT